MAKTTERLKPAVILTAMRYTCKPAYQAAHTCRVLRKEGIDPIEHKKQLEATKILEQAKLHNLQGMRTGIHQFSPSRMEKSQARTTMAQHPRNLCPPFHWQ